MMHALKSICSLFQDDPDQMDHRIAALHAFIQPSAFHDVAVDPLEIVFASDVLSVEHQSCLLPRQTPQRRSHGMAFHQQSLQHVLANKACGAGEENFHGENCTCCIDDVMRRDYVMLSC